jgi:hypothetical protein
MTPEFRDGNWRLHGKCRDTTVNMTPDPQSTVAIEAAKAVCSRCPVKAPCLEFAIASRDRHSVLAGLAPGEGPRPRIGKNGGDKPRRRRVCDRCGNTFDTARANRRKCDPCRLVLEWPAPDWLIDRRAQVFYLHRRGWSDEQIANEMGAKPKHVEAVRRRFHDEAAQRYVAVAA